MIQTESGLDVLYEDDQGKIIQHSDKITIDYRGVVHEFPAFTTGFYMLTSCDSFRFEDDKLYMLVDGKNSGTVTFGGEVI